MPAASVVQLPAASRHARVSARRERWRRWAARSRAGVAIAPVPYTAATVDTLTHLGYLDNNSPATSEAVGAAIAELIKLIR
jgi:hypothetical protein